jgi:alpha-soluble NSF attachment protein
MHSRCRLKIAEFSAELGRYPKAVEMFEEALKRAVENNLLKFSVRATIA